MLPVVLRLAWRRREQFRSSFLTPTGPGPCPRRLHGACAAKVVWRLGWTSEAPCPRFPETRLWRWRWHRRNTAVPAVVITISAISFLFSSNSPSVFGSWLSPAVSGTNGGFWFFRSISPVRPVSPQLSQNRRGCGTGFVPWAGQGLLSCCGRQPPL